MNNVFKFHEIGRFPLPGDNVAIATRRLEAGTGIVYEGQRFALAHTVLEGHRFAVAPIGVGEALLSWGLPFGVARREISVGSYVCNSGMLHALRGRNLDFELPTESNFEDRIAPYVLDEGKFEAAQQVALYEQPRTFMGYRRTAQRGVGTRNIIVLLGTTSRTGGYVTQLEKRLAGLADAYEHVDGIMAVAHTEGGEEQPNNLALVLRTLAGFMVHPNVGAVLAVDYDSEDGWEAVTNQMLRAYMEENGYPLDEVPHHFLSLGLLKGGFQANLEQGAAIVEPWLEVVNRTPRTAESVAHLKLALQCGGSDAFSGVSGNPLASWVAKEVIGYGGAANLAETDEVVGAESYVLQKVKDIQTARKFLATIARFKEWASWHGTTAEGNPSGGNKFRGLYNIALKSIGAAMKRHPDVRLDHVIDYGEPMRQPGYYFMDSPGNDLESIAGQVAAGCNMIFFVTGNGSITNFPFVPTIKIVTTTQRYDLLSQEMDVNAGAYLDGTPMDQLGQNMFDLTIEVASGQRSVGEKAGHAQVQLWRNWQQSDASQLKQLLNRAQPSGASLPIKTNLPIPVSSSTSSLRFQAIRRQGGHTSDQIGLIMPTSLCSGQIGRMSAAHLNQKGLGREQQLSRFVSLIHTEGCGASSGASEALYIRTALGYISHPIVKHCLLLEHGCEKTHNDYMRHHIEQMGLDPSQLGWASVQLDGGIQNVMQKIEDWFSEAISQAEPPQYDLVGLESLRLGLVTAGSLSATASETLAQLTKTIVAAGGTVVLPQNTDLLTSPTYLEETLGDQPANPSLAYGQQMPTNGFHIMQTPSSHWVETLTGLGATGVELILAHIGQTPMPSHPMIPLIQVTTDPIVAQQYVDDIDLVLQNQPNQWTHLMLERLIDVISHTYTPKLYQQGHIDFQITRGLLGISL